MSLLIEKLFAKTAHQGAATSRFAALDPRLATISGRAIDSTDSKSDSKYAKCVSSELKLQQWVKRVLNFKELL